MHSLSIWKVSFRDLSYTAVEAPFKVLNAGCEWFCKSLLVQCKNKSTSLFSSKQHQRRTLNQFLLRIYHASDKIVLRLVTAAVAAIVGRPPLVLHNRGIFANAFKRLLTWLLHLPTVETFSVTSVTKWIYSLHFSDTQILTKTALSSVLLLLLLLLCSQLHSQFFIFGECSGVYSVRKNSLCTAGIVAAISSVSNYSHSIGSSILTHLTFFHHSRPISLRSSPWRSVLSLNKTPI